MTNCNEITISDDISFSMTVIVHDVSFGVQIHSYNREQPLLSQTYLEIIRGDTVVGYLKGFSNPGDTVPLIGVLKKGETNLFNTEKGVYHGEEGREIATKYLQNLSETQLHQALLKTFFSK